MFPEIDKCKDFVRDAALVCPRQRDARDALNPRGEVRTAAERLVAARGPLTDGLSIRGARLTPRPLNTLLTGGIHR